MATRSYDIFENNSTVVDPGITWTDVIDQTCTNAAGDHLFIYHVELQSGSVASFARVRLALVGSGGTQTVHGRVDPVFRNTVDRQTINFAFPMTVSAATRVRLQIWGSASSATSVRARVTRIALTPDDKYIYSEDGGSTTATTHQIALQVPEFTPASERDYLIIGNIITRSDPATAPAYVTLNPGSGVINNLVGCTPHNVASEVPAMMLAKTTYAASPQGPRVNYRAHSGCTATWTEASVVALDLSGFATNLFASLASDVSGTQIAATTALTVTGTVQARPHLVFCAGFAAVGSNTATNYVANDFQSGGTSIMQSRRGGHHAASERASYVGSAGIETYGSAGSRTYLLTRRSNSTSWTSYVKQGTAIAVLDLEEGGGPPPPTGTAYAYAAVIG